ncbi:MAG: hypothetical protein L0H53_09400 [Candidatus Nitrosocosmicus sp.]|nr:hypothetical protein [Candidatus Nitrosocosmicus sp.]
MEIPESRFTNCYLKNNFVNAFDEFQDINRKLFDIPEIDSLLSFDNKKNICIVNYNQSSQHNFFPYSLITNACIDHHTNTKNFSSSVKKTILVDAGSGNNLGYVYLDLVNKSLNGQFDIDKILDQIIIARAFTFYQLLNIIINEIPKLIDELRNCKIQIIIMDFLDTLFSSSNRIKSKKSDFKYNEKLVNEMLDTLAHISTNHFVILTCDNSNNDNLYHYLASALDSKISNCIEIHSSKIDEVTFKKKKKSIGKDTNTQPELLLKVRSDITVNSCVSIDSEYSFKNHTVNSSIRDF